MTGHPSHYSKSLNPKSHECNNNNNISSTYHTSNEKKNMILGHCIIPKYNRFKGCDSFYEVKYIIYLQYAICLQ